MTTRAYFGGALAWVGFGIVAVACSGAPRGTARVAPVANALDSKVEWTKVPTHAEHDLRGNDVQVVDVIGGEVVQITTDERLDVGERVRSGAGYSETWATLAPKDGAVTLRASLLTHAILIPKGKASRVHVARGSEPGYAWFDLESRVIAWADGPIPAPFPAIAPRERVDFEGFATLDRALLAGIASARDKDAARDAATAIRTVAGLRAVRSLRPINGFPYFYGGPISGDALSAKSDTAIHTADHDRYLVSEKSPLELSVEGPTMLHVFSQGVRAEEDETVQVRVMEGTRERATSAGAVPKVGRARTDQPENPAEKVDLLLLRRALVHVPPGSHRYRIEVHGGAAYVSAVTAKPVVHLGDSITGIKSEDDLLAAAHRGCDDNAPDVCALTLALEGREVDRLESDATKGRANSGLRFAVDMLAQGGPRDPSIALEVAAAAGDATALAKLGDAAVRLIDTGLRDAWLRGTTRGTRWLVSERYRPPTRKTDHASTSETATWTALVFDAEDSKACALAGDAPWTEVGEQEAEFAAGSWRGAPTLELLAAASCDKGAPLGLVVDGEPLSPNPSSPLAKWHILVKGGSAKARRVGPVRDGHIFAIRPDAARCGAHWGHIGAPQIASSSPSLSYADHVTAPGIEVWLREGAKLADVTVTPSTVDHPVVKSVRIVAAPRQGFVAVDDKGLRWVRVARVGLPPWAATGALVVGTDDVAVRPIVRAPKAIGESAQAAPPVVAESAESRKEAEPLDEGVLTALSREILAAAPEARGPLYLKRAMMLAVSAAQRAAFEDARAAKALRAVGPNGEDAISLVRDTLRPKPRKPLSLSSSVKAYGIEPDFDADAPRCSVKPSGPRARLASIIDELKTEALAQSAAKSWDPALAARAFEAIGENPADPRGRSVLARALAGSKWQTPRALEGAPTKVQRPHVASREGALDENGELRARVATGQPFEAGSYATITDTRPAKAGLTGATGAKAKVEIACVARSPADARSAPCPISVGLGTSPPKRPNLGADGRGSIELEGLPRKGVGTHLTISLAPAPGRFIAVARVVFDREVPGATKVDNVGYVLMPPGLEYRYYLKSGEQMSTTLPGAGLVRIDARSEPDEHTMVSVTIDGKEHPLSPDGEPRIFATMKGGPVVVKSVAGAITVGFAERVARAKVPDLAALAEAEAEPTRSDIADAPESSARSTTALLDANAPNAPWRLQVDRSPTPLSGFQEGLGTVVVGSLLHRGTLREGDPSAAAPDSYFEQSVGYRRQIESALTWLGLSGLYRVRAPSKPTFGVDGLTFVQLPARFRFVATAGYFGQHIDFNDVRTFRPRGYLEMSAKLASSVYLLPRIGYDGFYTTQKTRPLVLDDVDDTVYNGFRQKRPTELFAQLMGWWVPNFNDVFYLRGRVTFDALQKAMDHASIRPGFIFAFGDAEVGIYGDTSWYRATEGLRPTSKWEQSGAAYALYNLWLGAGSLDIQPGLGGRARAADGGWEMYALVNILGNYHRGLRDFSFPELAFPEQLGGLVPWRGPALGGTR